MFQDLIDAVAGYADGMTAGAMGALAKRVERDFNKPATAARILALRERYTRRLADASDENYEAGWSAGSLSAWRRFDRPMTAEQAYGLWRAVSENLARDVAGPAA